MCNDIIMAFSSKIHYLSSHEIVVFVNSITAVILNKEQLLSTKREAVRRLSRTGMMTKRVDSSIVVVDVYRLEETWVIDDNTRMNRQMATHPFYWELCPCPTFKYSTVCRLIFYKECSWVKVNIFHAKGRSRTLEPSVSAYSSLSYPINFIVWWQFASCLRPQIFVFLLRV